MTNIPAMIFKFRIDRKTFWCGDGLHLRKTEKAAFADIDKTTEEPL
jgi:hypothetical protein